MEYEQCEYEQREYEQREYEQCECAIIYTKRIKRSQTVTVPPRPSSGLQV
jgi:hypothetical protein